MEAKLTKWQAHAAGIALIILAFSSLAAMSSLPGFSEKDYQLPFLPKSGKTVHLVFAGYPGCGSICPTSMSLLKHVYSDIADKAELLPPDVTFVNVELNTPRSVSTQYAQSWHKDFRGYSIHKDEANSVYKELAVQSYSTNQDSSAHQGYIYLFNREKEAWKLVKAYAEPPELGQIKNDVAALKPAYF